MFPHSGPLLTRFENVGVEKVLGACWH